MTVDWGDVPTWITTAAVGFAAVQFSRDTQARRDDAVIAARRQATGLSAWAGSIRGDDGKPLAYGVVVANDSGLPFREVVVDAVLHDHDQKAVEMLVLPPGQYFLELGRDGSWDFASSVDEYDRHVRPYTRTVRYRVREVRFRDAAGAGWRLDDDGHLHAVD